MLTTAKTDVDAYNSAMTMSTAELVAALRSLLGVKLVAYLGRVKETRAVRQWAEGTRAIANPVDLDRLRVAYRAAVMITARDSNDVAQAWFQGLNPLLEDRSPARVLRDGDLAEAGPRVLAAARQFAAVGSCADGLASTPRQGICTPSPPPRGGASGRLASRPLELDAVRIRRYRERFHGAGTIHQLHASRFLSWTAVVAL
jgi:hypothetical protein